MRSYVHCVVQRRNSKASFGSGKRFSGLKYKPYHTVYRKGRTDLHCGLLSCIDPVQIVNDLNALVGPNMLI
jgi:hypothetical protein